MDQNAKGTGIKSNSEENQTFFHSFHAKLQLSKD